MLAPDQKGTAFGDCGLEPEDLTRRKGLTLALLF